MTSGLRLTHKERQQGETVLARVRDESAVALGRHAQVLISQLAVLIQADCTRKPAEN
jgi:hypothetical protein